MKLASRPLKPPKFPLRGPRRGCFAPPRRPEAHPDRHYHPRHFRPGTFASGAAAPGGDLAASEPLLREALDVRRETLGNRHPRTLASIRDLGNLLKAKGDLAAAEPLLREAGSARF